MFYLYVVGLPRELSTCELALRHTSLDNRGGLMTISFSLIICSIDFPPKIGAPQPQLGPSTATRQRHCVREYTQLGQQ